MSEPQTIVIAGALAQKPGRGGHAWVLLQYLLGFRRLGYEVLFVDRLEPGMCLREDGQGCPPEESLNLRYLRAIMAHYGLDGSFAVSYDGGRVWLGLSRDEVQRRVRRAALVIDIMGYLRDEPLLATAPRAFLDIDPGFTQMWHALGLAAIPAGYDCYLTIGERIGRADCHIPTCDISWQTTRPPVVLALWPCLPLPSQGAITSVASWRGAYGPVEYAGQTYGLRVHEFRRFAALPRLSGASFELALAIHPDETRDLELLAANGWLLVDPLRVAETPEAYQAYVQQSRAELMIAKHMYVQSHSGWFSDRSVCYLASGRPVLALDTGLQGLYPTGAGLLTFATPEEALEALIALETEYPRHARAARRIAEEYFDSDQVLTRLLQVAGVHSAQRG